MAQVEIAGHLYESILLADPTTGAPVAPGSSTVASIADGADVAQGSTTDAAVVSDANGTLSGKLRGLVKMISDMWDSTNHVLNIGGKAAVGLPQRLTRCRYLAWMVGA